MKKLLISLFFLLFLLFTTLPLSYPQTYKGKNGLIHYLTSVCYDSSISLCWDSPIYYRNQVWVTPDNKIAYFSLIHVKPSIAEKIGNKLKSLASTYNLPTDWLGFPITYKHDSLFGVELPSHNGFNKSSWITLTTENGYTLKVDIANDTEKINDWDAYADLCIYEALDLYIKGNITKSKQLLTHVIQMWDGIGVKDREYFNNGGKYETYKLALLYYANQKINDNPLSFENELIERIWEQQAENGGIYTHYKANGDKAFSDTNVETTALVLYADIPEIETITEVWYDNPVNYVIIIGVIAFIFLLGKELIK